MSARGPGSATARGVASTTRSICSPGALCLNRAVARTLFIVSRRHTELYDYLKERFAGDDQVEVILDRRSSGQGHRVASPEAPPRSPERRARPEVDTELETRSHAVITVA